MGKILVIVDQSAVLDELVGRPPNDRQANDPQQKGGVSLYQEQPGGRGESGAVNARVGRALFDADSRHQDNGQNKPKHHPANSARHFSPIKHLNQKENQAADEEHDEQGIEGGDEVIQDCFLNSLLGTKFRDLPAAGAFVRRDHGI